MRTSVCPQGLLQIAPPGPFSQRSYNPLTHDTCFIVCPKGLFLAASGPFEPEDIFGAFSLQTLQKSQFTCCKDIPVNPSWLRYPSSAQPPPTTPVCSLPNGSYSCQAHPDAGCSLCWNVPCPDSPTSGIPHLPPALPKRSLPSEPAPTRYAQRDGPPLPPSAFVVGQACFPPLITVYRPHHSLTCPIFCWGLLLPIGVHPQGQRSLFCSSRFARYQKQFLAHSRCLGNVY